jgi:hypothetical protein
LYDRNSLLVPVSRIIYILTLVILVWGLERKEKNKERFGRTKYEKAKQK